MYFKYVSNFFPITCSYFGYAKWVINISTLKLPQSYCNEKFFILYYYVFLIIYFDLQITFCNRSTVKLQYNFLNIILNICCCRIARYFAICDMRNSCHFTVKLLCDFSSELRNPNGNFSSFMILVFYHVFKTSSDNFVHIIFINLSLFVWE